jgi:hypothetical protein
MKIVAAATIIERIGRHCGECRKNCSLIRVHPRLEFFRASIFRGRFRAGKKLQPRMNADERG